MVAVLSGRTGSGYLLAPRLVLTAAHAVADVRSLRAAAVRGTGVRDCRLIWQSPQSDVALLLADRDLVRTDVAARLEPVRWARPPDDSPIDDCQVMGFPHAERRPDELLDVQHIECALRPGSGIVRDRYILDIKDVAPEPVKGESPWQGMSGAALFARGHVLGVVVAASRNWGHRRLEAAKSRMLLDDPQFVEALSQYISTAPTMIELPAVTRHRTQLALGGALHSTPEQLAETVRAEWSMARGRFFETMGTAERPSEGWANLLAWIREFDDPAIDDVESRLELVDRWLTSPDLSPDLKLLRLLSWLDPQGPAVWCGTTLTIESLAEACLAGRVEEEGPAARLYRDLCAGGLLDALAEFAELRTLRGTQRDWDTAWSTWCELVAEFGTRLPIEVREWASGPSRGMLLAAVLPDAVTQRVIHAVAERVTPPATGAVWWYDEMTARNSDPDSPVGKLLRTDIAGFATADLVREREQWLTNGVTRAAAERYDREWAAYEVGRRSLAARLGAALRAAVWIAEWAAALIGLTWLVWGLPEPAIARETSWQFALFALAAFAGRLPGVVRLGAAYRPPLLTWAGGGRGPDARAVLARTVGVLVAPVVVGVLVHDLGSVLTTVYVALAMICVFRFTRRGGMHDWDEEHQERLREYETGKNSPLTPLVQGVRSRSPRDRAEAYRALLDPHDPDRARRLPPGDGRNRDL
ncbi:serine protease [Actinoallomurus sp. WRP6H-15]|nr:serine protease [Actinoallomurus soli]